MLFDIGDQVVSELITEVIEGLHVLRMLAGECLAVGRYDDHGFDVAVADQVIEDVLEPGLGEV